MNCEHTREQLADWLNGSLTNAQRAGIEKHLVHCLRCQEEFAENKQLWSAMRQINIAVPSENMKVQFNAMLDDFRLTQKYERKNILTQWLEKMKGFLTPQLALQFTFCFLLVGLGGMIGYYMKRPETTATAYEQQIDTLAGQVQQMKMKVMLALLNDPSATERIRAVGYSTDITNADDRVLEALFATLNSDPNVNVRLVTLEALTQFADDALVREKLIKSLRQQDSPMVQVALADVMLKLQEKRAVKAFRELLEKEDLNDLVKIKIEQTIKDLS
ncbi:zf-HC2 domain-containing protein [Dyadobacter sp. NIV53]|uniref:zf-HC2 domain-containing protein n=1 Tax=Dyadobacter sp. NIV53 TaxID=2861765 RepID=UPI001C875AF8|nr:HEAT repeat domain-containing protein [Dyadobacter sp. NIV53]